MLTHSKVLPPLVPVLNRPSGARHEDFRGLSLCTNIFALCCNIFISVALLTPGTDRLCRYYERSILPFIFSLCSSCQFHHMFSYHSRISSHLSTKNKAVINFSKWKNISHMYVIFKSQIHFSDSLVSPSERLFLKLYPGYLLTSFYPSSYWHLQCVHGIFRVYSDLVGVNWQDNRCHCCPVGRTDLSEKHDLHTQHVWTHLTISSSATKHSLAFSSLTGQTKAVYLYPKD